MANTLLTISKITREALMVLENNTVFAKAVNKQYSDEFAVKGAKVGTVVNVRKPPRYKVTSGPSLQLQDATETFVPVAITNQDHVDIAFTSQDLTLSIDEFSDRFLKPSLAALANQVDYNGLQLYKKIYNMVGTPGTPPAAAADVLAVGRRLSEEAAPNQRSMIVGPGAQASLVGGLSALFNPSNKISSQFTEGAMGAGVLGFDFAMDQNAPAHTYGTCVSFTNNGAIASSVLTTSGADVGLDITANAITGTITAGSVGTFAGVYAVNPQSRQNTGVLRQFVVTADAANGATTINIFPRPIFSGPFQNCTSASGTVPNGTTFTLASASSNVHQQSLGFAKDAFTLATADLVVPGGVDMAARENYNGLSLRIVRQYDINNDVWPCRIDVLYGWKTIYPELACRMTS